jgi:hypothetical protein
LPQNEKNDEKNEKMLKLEFLVESLKNAELHNTPAMPLTVP